jgi:hypothetical protein
MRVPSRKQLNSWSRRPSIGKKKLCDFCVRSTGFTVAVHGHTGQEFSMGRLFRPMEEIMIYRPDQIMHEIEEYLVLWYVQLRGRVLED